jgi:PmbA protein
MGFGSERWFVEPLGFFLGRSGITRLFLLTGVSCYDNGFSDLSITAYFGFLMTQFSYALHSLEQMAHDALKLAKAKGATDAVMNVSEGHGISVSVRNQQPETVELMRDKGFGVTVHLGHRRGHASSSDFSQESIARTVDAALDIARYTAQDECAALPDADLFADAQQKSRDLPLYFAWDVGTEQAVHLANTMEQAGFDTSRSIDNSDGASVSTYHGQFILANSAGFSGGYPFTRHSVGVAYIARQGEQMQRDGWYSSARCPSDLTDPKILGHYAAQKYLYCLKLPWPAGCSAASFRR